jgi:hypothetical protein
MTLYSYRFGLASLAAAGTGTISATSTALTGSGTNFDPELVAGTVIFATASGQTLAVASMTNDTNAVLVTAPVTPLSGAAFTYLHMVNVEALIANFPPPRSKFRPYVVSVDLGNGAARGLGRPLTSWLWGFLTQAQRNALRQYFPGRSTACYINTRKNDASDAYVTYSAICLWPDEEDRQTTRRLNFTLEFRNLISL